MLSRHAVSPKVLLPRRPDLSFIQAARLISTNTAINRSLRKLKKNPRNRDTTGKPRSLEPVFGSKDGKPTIQPRSRLTSQYAAPDLTAPLRKQTRNESRYDYPKKFIEAERQYDDLKKQARIQSQYENLKTPTRAGSQSEYPKRPNRFQSQYDNFRQPNKAESQYDYSRKPGGNRATRRAERFGDSANDSAKDEVTDLAQLLPGRPRAYQSAHHDHSKDTRSLHEALDKEADGNGRPMRKYRKLPSENLPEWPYQSEAPLALPYTTSASEFLYGTSVIKAALQAARRKFYKLYMYDGDNREVRDQDAAIRKLALKNDLTVERVKGDWLRLMDRMSQGRPHNGYILEASSLPKLPVTAIQRVENPQRFFNAVLDHQSREDEAINGTNTSLKYQPAFPRYPFILLLDGILDSGNLGAIMRSAFFLGVDAVAVSNHSAPFSPVALKASAGAAESLPLMTVAQPSTFIEACKRNGWKVYAADAPNESSTRRQKSLTSSNLGHPLRNHPCMLIFGSEGEGLRWKIQEKADLGVGIEGQRRGQSGVDSLNVSVAAGVLCEAFLRKPNSSKNLNGSRMTGVEAEKSLF
ncbi:MAG: hypothetical protein Q9164_000542 [Protoblastenia rupestris]